MSQNLLTGELETQVPPAITNLELAFSAIPANATTIHVTQTSPQNQVAMPLDKFQSCSASGPKGRSQDPMAIDIKQWEFRIESHLSGGIAILRERGIAYLVSVEFDESTRLLGDVLVFDEVIGISGSLGRSTVIGLALFSTFACILEADAYCSLQSLIQIEHESSS